MQYPPFLKKIILQFTGPSQQDIVLFNEVLKGSNSPLAEQISWLPLKNGGSNFKTNTLLQDDLGNLYYQASGGARAFSLLFIGAGTFAFIIMLIAFIGTYNAGNPDISLLIAMMIFPFVFIGVGIITLIHFSRRRTFDFQYGFFYIGKISADSMAVLTDKKRTPLKNVRAIQVVGENCSGSKGSRFRSYEINLVLQDASRVNVVDHGNGTQIILDAQRIATALKVPLWNMNTFYTGLNMSNFALPKIEDDKNQKLL